MADKKISELSSSASLTGTEMVPIVQSNTTVRTTVQDIADLAVGGGPGPSVDTPMDIYDTDLMAWIDPVSLDAIFDDDDAVSSFTDEVGITWSATGSGGEVRYTARGPAGRSGLIVSSPAHLTSSVNIPLDAKCTIGIAFQPKSEHDSSPSYVFSQFIAETAGRTSFAFMVNGSKSSLFNSQFGEKTKYISRERCHLILSGDGSNARVFVDGWELPSGAWTEVVNDTFRLGGDGSAPDNGTKSSFVLLDFVMVNRASTAEEIRGLHKWFDRQLGRR